MFNDSTYPLRGGTREHIYIHTYTSYYCYKECYPQLFPGKKGGRKTSPICGWVCWRVVCRVSQWVITYTVSQLQQQCQRRRVFFWGEVYFLDDLIDSNKRNAAKLQGRRFFSPGFQQVQGLMTTHGRERGGNPSTTYSSLLAAIFGKGEVGSWQKSGNMV